MSPSSQTDLSADLDKSDYPIAQLGRGAAISPGNLDLTSKSSNLQPENHRPVLGPAFGNHIDVVDDDAITG